MKSIVPSLAAVCLLIATPSVRPADAASPSVEQALELAPTQKGVDCDRPTADLVAKCKISARKIGDGVGWIVLDPDGLTLRRFVDTNGDNVVDRWCYYKNGLEVYRDIDADFDGKADQFRWLHTAGCRWGIDNDKDGQIDAREVISAEEVTAEMIAALAGSGFFLKTSPVPQNVPAGIGSGEDGEKLLAELESLDREAEKATTPQKQAEFNARRADLLEKIAENTRSSADRAMWLRQLADMVSAAVQSGTYPGGVKRLESLFAKLQKNHADKNLAAYVRFRQLTAEYALALQSPKADFAKIQTQWLKSLKTFVADYPKSPETAEAMLQLAIAEEFAGEEDKAKQWYSRVVETFPDSPAAKKAAGAKTRLNSVGKTIRFSGKNLSGSRIDLAKYRGRVVLIQYWATWCEPALNNMPMLKKLVKKYGGKFSVIGVSLDGRRKDLEAFLAENKLPWPQIFEPGGLDSRPANQLGILTLPTMILLDRQGKVVSRNIQAAELDGELKKLIR